MDDTALSRIVGDLYDAAVEPALWDGVLHEARDYVGGTSAAIYSRDVMGASFAIHHEDHRIDTHYKQLYFDEFARLDPMSTGQSMSTAENPLSSTDIIDYRELRATRIYQEWIRPQGFIDFINITLEKSPGEVRLFGIFRHERDGMVDDDARRRMQALGPHLRRAVLIGASFAAKAAENAAFADMMDGLNTALFLVRPGGQIVHANAAGLEMLAAAHVVRAPKGRLTAIDPTANRSLGAAIVAAAEGDGAIGRRAVALPLPAQNGESQVAHVLPLTSGARRQAGQVYGATSAVFVRKVTLNIQSTPAVIASQYRLTPSELRVLFAIVDIGGVPEVADSLGVSVTTAKTHLNRVYAKTGLGRQADLVKLVAGFASPLLS